VNSQNIRILLADDHDVVRAGLRVMLETCIQWHVCAEASDGKSAVRLAAAVKPDVVVLDLELGDMQGLTAISLIRKNRPEIEIVVFTMHDDDQLIRDVLALGVAAYVLKSEGGRSVIRAIENAWTRRQEGHVALQASPSRQPGRPELRRAAKKKGGALTEREKELVHLLALGNSNKEVAEMLGISVKTVETHRAAVMRKLGLTSLVGLVRYAVRENFIAP
jgi:DNA-binding NarL/FixJ family response regulator